MAMSRELAALINDRRTVAALERHFRRVLDRIKRQVGVGVTRPGAIHIASTIREINRLVGLLDPRKKGFVRRWIIKNIAKAYILGDRATSRELLKVLLKAAGKPIPPGTGAILTPAGMRRGFTVLNNDGVRGLTAAMNATMGEKASQMRDALGTTIRRTQVTFLQSQQIQDATVSGIIKGATAQQVRDDIASILLRGKVSAAVRRRLAAQGFDTALFNSFEEVARGTLITVGKRRFNVASYSNLVARTQMREAHKVATITRLQANGIDHVKVSRHFQQKIDECTPFAGQVFYIGPLAVDPAGFPKLSTTVNGGVPFHPNCQHVITPWVIHFQTDEAIDQELTKVKQVPRRLFNKTASQVRKEVGKLTDDEIARLFPDGFEDVERFRTGLAVA